MRRVRVKELEKRHRQGYARRPVKRGEFSIWDPQLHFAGEPPELLTGTRVRVRGVRIDGVLALESGRASVETLSQP